MEMIVNCIDLLLYLCTAAKTEMTLVRTLRNFNSLQDRCRATIVSHLTNGFGTIDRLPVPSSVKSYIRELIHFGDAEHDCQRSEVKRIALSERTEKTRHAPRRCLKDWSEIPEIKTILSGCTSG